MHTKGPWFWLLILIYSGSCLFASVESVCVPDAFFPDSKTADLNITPFLLPGVTTGLTMCDGIQNTTFFLFISPSNGTLELYINWTIGSKKLDLDLLMATIDLTPRVLLASSGDQRNNDPAGIEMIALDFLENEAVFFEIRRFFGSFENENDTFTIVANFIPNQISCFIDEFNDTNSFGLNQPTAAVDIDFEVSYEANMCAGFLKGYRILLEPNDQPYIFEFVFTERDPTNRLFVSISQEENQIFSPVNSSISPFQIPFLHKQQDTTNFVIVVSGFTARAWSMNYTLRVNRPLALPPGTPPVDQSRIVAIAIAVPLSFSLLFILSISGALYYRRWKRLTKPQDLPALEVIYAAAPKIDKRLLAPDRVLKRHEIDYRELSDTEPIGKGSFGVVYRAKWRETFVAVKQLNENLIDNEKALADFRGEGEILASLRSHPNVVLFLGITSDPQPVTIITEFCENGSLHRLIKSDVKIPIELEFKLLNGIARGMFHLHSENIIHRDLAARNILLAENYTPKVSDFGMSRQKATSSNSLNEAQKTTAEVGPLKWMAPESIIDRVYSFKTDVYSFAITMWELIARDDPYPNLDTVGAAMKVCYEGLRPEVPEHGEQDLKELMKMCWDQNPEKRPTFKEICQKIQVVTKELGVADFSENSLGGGGDYSRKSKMTKPVKESMYGASPAIPDTIKLSEPPSLASSAQNQSQNLYGASPVPITPSASEEKPKEKLIDENSEKKNKKKKKHKEPQEYGGMPAVETFKIPGSDK